ncbi:glycosyltransferase family protein [Oligella urethralis]|uniref:MJ1255/VC2487 family glycosyltransferase n=1 Tax=Oligella urethralis TaxID=90245 RepID=UPI00254CB7D1|nr:MJ1255/VC2487 family glycosyltransferase [Oligella urethralis]MDK6202901.1 glycosyltransferase family protein [Oligella urethralis]
MRILYGVQGTGNGHITRARVMLPALQAAGCKVDFVFSGRPANAYFDMAMFGDYRAFQGFSFYTKQGAVNWFKTVSDARPLRFIKDVSALNVKDYDLVLTDFEPVSAWAAKLRGVPAIGLAHQYALCHAIPGTEKSPLLAQALKSFAPAKHYIGVHWAPYDAPIVPPLIAMNHEQATREEDFILVYLPFEDTAQVIQWLQQIPEQRFIVYRQGDTTVQDKNILVKPLSREHFPQDLAACAGVICNTGFGLCSEAMVLGKKIYTKALAKQVEQFSNGKILEDLNRAVVFTEFETTALRQWLMQANPPRAVFPPVAEEVAAWIVSQNYEDWQGLVTRLWARAEQVAL